MVSVKYFHSTLERREGHKGEDKEEDRDGGMRGNQAAGLKQRKMEEAVDSVARTFSGCFQPVIFPAQLSECLPVSFVQRGSAVGSVAVEILHLMLISHSSLVYPFNALHPPAVGNASVPF